MQDEKEMVREEENETPEAPDQEEALKQSEADTETEQGEAAEADKKPRKEKQLFKKDRTAELDAKIEAAAADYQELARLMEEKQQAEDTLAQMMEQWEAFSCELEDAT